MDIMQEYKDEIESLINKGNVKSISGSKTSLGMLIKWTSSKYNEMKKVQVINDILDRIYRNDNLIWKYECGSYVEGNHNRGCEYILYCNGHDYYILSIIGNRHQLFRLKGV